MERTEQIETILRLSRKPCPDVVEVFHERHKRTGETCSIWGMPRDFKAEDWETVSAGRFVYRAKDGTTFGTGAKSAEELRQLWEASEDRKAADFRAILERDTPERLQEQYDFWTGETARKQHAAKVAADLRRQDEEKARRRLLAKRRRDAKAKVA